MLVNLEWARTLPLKKNTETKFGGATQCEGLRRHRRWWLGVPPTEELMRARVGLSCEGGFIWGDSCPRPSINIRDCAIHMGERGGWGGGAWVDSSRANSFLLLSHCHPMQAFIRNTPGYVLKGRADSWDGWAPSVSKWHACSCWTTWSGSFVGAYRSHWASCLVGPDGCPVWC